MRRSGYSVQGCTSATRNYLAGMPPKPLPDHLKRKERRTYMTDSDWQRIEATAARLDLSASEFVRQAALSACDRAEAHHPRRRRRL